MAQADNDRRQIELAEFNAVVEAANRFSSTLFKHMVKISRGNLIWSPLSAALILAMAGYGAREETEIQFQEVLCLPALDDVVRTGYQELIDTLNNITESRIYIANKVFVTEKCSVKPTYDELTETYFRSATKIVNFKRNEEAADIINEWVAQETSNRIKELISAKELSEETSMILVSTIYFRAEWQDEFKVGLTVKRPFYITKKITKSVPMMTRRGNYKYDELHEMDAKFVEIPYKGGELSMVIIVPNEINGLQELQKKLQNTSLTSILERGQLSLLELFLPKFEFWKKIELNSVLKNMGLIDTFEDRADFNGISDAQLKISKVLQKTFINVNECGTNTPMGDFLELKTPVTKRLYLRVPHYFRVDRPSYYAICHNNNHVVLLSGLIRNPFRFS